MASLRLLLRHKWRRRYDGSGPRNNNFIFQMIYNQPRTNSGFPVIYKAGKIDIFVQLLMRKKMELVSNGINLLQIYICNGALK